ncbi:MAG: double-strand break repair helicase AddA [Azospirillaceae bacterium]|nr:double-strand break repair helicase AddA [Azospirillaceae bacterium]
MSVDTAGLPPDPAIQQRRASDPGCSVWVGASAGTGKTKVLTDRVLRLMLSGTPPHRILCLTFTKAAAAEMANRINKTLGEWTIMADDRLADRLAELTGERPANDLVTAARRLFARVVDCPGGMRIDTIHAFCQSLLRRFPLEAGLPPHFETMDDRTAAELLREARNRMLFQARTEPDTARGQALARIAGAVPEGDFDGLMAELTAERGRLGRIFAHHGGLGGTVDAIYRLLDVTAGEDDDTVAAAAVCDPALDEYGLRSACAALAAGSPTDRERGLALAAWLESPPERRLSGFADYIRLFLTAEEQPRKVLITRKAATPAAQLALEGEAARLVTVAQRRRSAAVAAGTVALLTLAEALLVEYEQAKSRQGLLDYDDLILATLRLLTTEGVAPWVLYKLDGGLDHILVDEAQDTNPDQWAVIAALAEEFFAGEGAVTAQRTVFAVGDEKQSIFSFQRADPVEFARMRRHFAERVGAAGQRWTPIDLETSFRSTAAVLSTVDAVFARDQARDGIVTDPAQTVTHRPFRRGQAGLVELWPAVAPVERDAAQPWALPVGRTTLDLPATRLARIIAATIRRWIDDGEVLEARGRPIQPGDIMVLVRRRTAFVDTLVRALKDCQVPIAGVDRLVLTRHIAVMDLIALGEFLLMPDDDLTLASVLKGPLIGFDDDRLYALAYGRETHLWATLSRRAGENPAFAAARDFLSGALSQTDFVAPFELFAGILGAPCPADSGSGRRAMLARLGPDAIDPLDEFLSAAIAFERSHPPSLQGFLAWLAASEAEIKRELEQDHGGRVRIMTVHGSKGLQAPVVFLPDTMAVPTQSPRILWPEQDRGVPLFAIRRDQEEQHCRGARSVVDHRRDQEYRRLLYVALTRAEDRLIVAGYQGQRQPSDNCWYHLVGDALQAVAAPVAFDFTDLGPDGWTSPGWRLRDRQTAAPPAATATTAPAPAGPAAVPEWAWQPPAPEPWPTRPLTPSRPEIEPAVRSPLGADDGMRFQRGLLVHKLLQVLPDLPVSLRPAAAARFLGRAAHDLTPQRQAELAAETLTVLENPAFSPWFGPGSRGEVPIVGVVNGRVVSGQIDRLLVALDGVWIIDYKTNRPAPETEAEVSEVYLRQLAAYRAVIARIYPDRPIHGVLIWTDGPRAMPLSPERLDFFAP